MNNIGKKIQKINFNLSLFQFQSNLEIILIKDLIIIHKNLRKRLDNFKTN